MPNYLSLHLFWERRIGEVFFLDGNNCSKVRHEIGYKSFQLCGKVKVTLIHNYKKDSYEYIKDENENSLIVIIKAVGSMTNLTFTKPVWNMVGQKYIYQYEKVFVQ